ncbi:MAG: hypothetical protein ACYC66_00190 [Chloroflexota bacterium]
MGPHVGTPRAWVWGPMLASGYLLAFVRRPLRIRLMVPFLLISMVLLILHC